MLEIRLEDLAAVIGASNASLQIDVRRSEKATSYAACVRDVRAAGGSPQQIRELCGLPRQGENAVTEIHHDVLATITGGGDNTTEVKVGPFSYRKSTTDYATCVHAVLDAHGTAAQIGETCGLPPGGK